MTYFNALDKGFFGNKSPRSHVVNIITKTIEQGCLMLDNNASERRMKPIALGRKNYLFLGSERRGRAAAINYSIVET